MIPLDPTDTITAIASPSGPGFRGLVRLTGPRALAVALDGFMGEKGDAPLPRQPELRRGRLRVECLGPALPASVALWPGRRTYTGQPLAEIHTPGAAPLVQLVLAHCLARGARLAEPGEFTLRAFLSGRIDLTQAEAVLGVIDAHHPAQLDAALRQLAGGLSGPIARLRDRLLGVLAHLEAGLDFVEEADVDPIARAALAAELEAGADEVLALAHRLRGRDRPECLPRVVLVGPPNAGKSRLFNALVEDARAIVSHIAGTTRDYLGAPCRFDGVAAELIDTAGVEEADGAIAVQAQSHRASQAAQADLLLICHPSDSFGPPPDPPVDHPHLLVATRCDLAPAPPGLLPTSAATGVGLDTLRVALAAALRARLADGDALAHTGARCRDSLAHAGAALRAAAEALALGVGEELVSIDLRQAVDELGKVVGAVVTDDILDRIFARFCIGK